MTCELRHGSDVYAPSSAANLLVHSFFFNDTATTEIYTLSLHDALPISRTWPAPSKVCGSARPGGSRSRASAIPDRKSTRLNSSHPSISYAVFCLKKKKPTEFLLHGHYVSSPFLDAPAREQPRRPDVACI